jgi:hypothetical protein
LTLSIHQLTRSEAESIVESLRSGVPPQRFVSLYSAGGEDFLGAIRERHLHALGDRGRIRFVSGSWGSGKTHFLRRLREEAFEANFLVSSIQLSAQQAPLSHFERVIYEIVRGVCSPELYATGDAALTAPLGETLHFVLGRKAKEMGEPSAGYAVKPLVSALHAEDHIDVDMRRVVDSFWTTYAQEDPDSDALRDRRAMLLQWFVGEGQPGLFRRMFQVQKTITKENARIMLKSFGQLARFLGYSGLVVLIDEAEMAHSVMKTADLKQAQNNLLSLINEIEAAPGLFLVYATVPEFFIDPKFGIQTYGALAQRIGKPEEEKPRALAKVWNLDAAQPSFADLCTCAERIRDIYVKAYPDVAEPVGLIDVTQFTEDQRALHNEYDSISLWRFIVTAEINALDHVAEGLPLPSAQALRKSVLDKLRDD